MYELYKGIVVNSKDPDEQGKIQVRILPLCAEFKEADCPWLKPFSGGFYSEESVLSTYEKGALVWCLLDEYEKDKYVVAPYHVPLLFDFSVIKNILSQVSEITVTYEVMEFKKYNDGSIQFHNRETGDHGFVNSGGFYTVMDKDGNLIEKVKEKTITSTGSFTVNGNFEVLP